MSKIQKTKLRKKSRRNAGETLVEVVASMFIFLIMFGILQGAVSYSSAAMEKNKQIRKENAEILKNLQTATETTDNNSAKLISFQAVNSDKTKKGDIVFRVNTILASKQAGFTDSSGQNQTTTFYPYHVPESSTSSGTDEASGGDSGE